MKTNIVKKLTAGMMAAVLGATILAVPVSASGEVHSGFYDSVSGKVGPWNVDTQVCSLTSPTRDNVCGSDVGIWFFTPSVGLGANYVQTSKRKAYIKLYEYDWLYSDDDFAREYASQFEIVKGLYIPQYFWDNQVSKEGIEGEAEVELYMKYIIDEYSQDKSTSVPRGLFSYQFWII